MVLLRVVDNNLNDVPKDDKTMGEIVVKAPWVATKYCKDPDKTRDAFKTGWFRTGDISV